MTISRSYWLTGITGLASLAGVVHGQAFYGTDQSAACGAFPNFANLGCYGGDIRAASGYVFSPMNYSPSNPSNTYPGFYPGNDFNNTVTPSACAEACRGFGFRVAALYNGDCSCGYNDPVGTTLLTACVLPCTGDASQTCGGAPGFLGLGGGTQVFVDPSFADADVVAGTPQTQLASYYQRLGCFHISAGQEFPTQNRVNSAFASSTVQVCLESCALLRYPLAYASYNDANTVNCECGETFAAGVFRIDESTDTTGMCRASCTDGTPGTCDPTTGLCCATDDYASVYINPELEGCYTPTIPGFGQVGVVNSGPLVCASVAASLTGGPSTLARTVYPSATLNPYAPQPSHPLTVVGSTNPNTYYEYGCVAQPILNVAVGQGGAPAFTTANIPATSLSLEKCADACPGSVYFAVTDGDTCYCISGLAQNLAFSDFGLCNVRCTGLTNELCGGTNALEIYALQSAWNNIVANDISAALLANPIPSTPCTSGSISTTGSTSSTATTGSSSSTATSNPTSSATGSSSTSSGAGSASTTGGSSSGATGTASNSQTGITSSPSSGAGQSMSSGTGTNTGTGQSTGIGIPSGGGRLPNPGSGNGAGTSTNTGSQSNSGAGQSTGTGASSGAVGSSTGSGGAGTGASTGAGQPTGTAPGSGNGDGSTSRSGPGQQTGLPTSIPTPTSASNTASVSPTEPPSATRFIFGVVRIDADTSVVRKRDTFSPHSVNGGFIGNAGPGRRADAQEKRQDGFVGSAGSVNPADCRLATPFNFLGGQLSSGGELVSTDPGIPYIPFSTNPVAGSITTEFALSDDVLFWGNAAFNDFYADFCQDDAGQVWVVFGAAAPPFPCAPVILVVFDSNQCIKGDIISLGDPGVGTGIVPGAGLPTGTGIGIGAGSGLPGGTGTGLLPGAGTGIGTALPTGAGGATNSAPMTMGTSAGSNNPNANTALGGSSIVDGTLTIGDHTYAFPAQVTPGDYSCVTENATWAQGDAHPTFLAGVV